jgi:VCBS repeat-containing protein
MATQTTGGGSTTSFTNTPQAKDDSYYFTEDQLLGIWGAGQVITLDVMSNDLGGNAKSLFAIDDGNGNPLAPDFELLNKDMAGVWENTAQGNQIRLVAGKVEYKFNNDINGLAAGQTFTDVFVYSIRLGNGTLSQARVSITVIGSNDGPTAVADTNAGDAVTEAGVNPGNTTFPGDSTASGNVLANDTDPDAGAVLTVADVNGSAANVGNAVNGIYGSVVINSNGTYTYTLDNADSDTNALAQGASVTDVFNYTVTDEHGATSSTTLTITIIGTNDAPVAVADTNAGDAVTEAGVNPGNTPVPGDNSASGNVLANDTDVDAGDTKTVSAVNGLGANVGGPVLGTYGSVTIDSDGTYTYTLDNGDPQTQALTQGEIVTDIFTYTVIDANGATSSTTLTISITGTNDQPVITSDGGDATASASVAENSTAVTIVTATDPDAGATVTFSIVGGADSALFTIDPNTGALAFVSAPDFEAPEDAGGDNVYDVVVRASDGSASDDQAIAVTVTNVNEAPTITSDGGGATASASVAENTTAVTTVTATDPDAGATITFSIVGGADSALFTIDPNTGALAFVAAPDFETPGDAGADNVYDVVVRASDGSLFDDQAIAVTVTDVNEAPTITSDGGGATASASVAENTTAVTTVTATDPDAGATITFSIVGGADSALFTIDPNTGALAFVTAPDFETPGDVGTDNIYDVIVRASDGSLFDDQAIAVTVTDVGEGPNAVGETIITNIALGTGILIPEWALLVNDPPSAVDVTNVGGATGGTVVHNAGVSSNGNVTFTDSAPAGGSFTYSATNGTSAGAAATVSIVQDAIGTLDGTANADILVSGTGGAILIGGDGNDVLLGGSGNDTYVFDLADGTDIVSDAGSGGDLIQVTTSAPLNSTSLGVLNFGRVGNDLIINVGSSSITIRGQYVGAGSVEEITFTNGGTIYGYALSTTAYDLDTDLAGDGNEDVIASSSASEILAGGGGNGNDLLFGNLGGDNISGGGGNDLIVGGGGDDILDGGADNDVLVGGLGFDMLMGGTGADRFVFENILDSTTTTWDRINDFAEAIAGELIDLSLIDANTALGGDQAFAAVNTSFIVTANSINWFQLGGNTFVQGDVNGDAVADFTIQLDGLHILTTPDFVL